MWRRSSMGWAAWLAVFPLSNRLIREMHEKLLVRGRGSERQPGEFRITQNWIGGSRPGVAHFVPPPPANLGDRMAALERFLHDKRVPYPALVKAGLAHVQFETIHPFLDGNGRIGRLLIALILHHEGVLSHPSCWTLAGISSSGGPNTTNCSTGCAPKETWRPGLTSFWKASRPRPRAR